MFVEEDLQGAFVDVRVTDRTDSEYILGQCRAVLRVRNEVMEVKPDLVRTTRCRTAPPLTTEYLPLLSFGGVSVARIEADSLVFDGWERVFQCFQVLGVGPGGGKIQPIRFLSAAVVV